jgi:hypothetical protein
LFEEGVLFSECVVVALIWSLPSSPVSFGLDVPFVLNSSIIIVSTFTLDELLVSIIVGLGVRLGGRGVTVIASRFVVPSLSKEMVERDPVIMSSTASSLDAAFLLLLFVSLEISGGGGGIGDEESSNADDFFVAALTP